MLKIVCLWLKIYFTPGHHVIHTRFVWKDTTARFVMLVKALSSAEYFGTQYKID